MNKRKFLTALSMLPFLGFIKPEAKASVPPELEQFNRSLNDANARIAAFKVSRSPWPLRFVGKELKLHTSLALTNSETKMPDLWQPTVFRLDGNIDEIHYSLSHCLACVIAKHELSEAGKDDDLFPRVQELLQKWNVNKPTKLVPPMSKVS